MAKDGSYIFKFNPMAKILVVFITVSFPLVVMDGTIFMPDIFSKIFFGAFYAMSWFLLIAVFRYRIVLQGDYLMARDFFSAKLLKLSQIRTIYDIDCHSAVAVEDIHGKKIRIYNFTSGASFLLEEIERRRDHLR